MNPHRHEDQAYRTPGRDLDAQRGRLSGEMTPGPVFLSATSPGFWLLFAASACITLGLSGFLILAWGLTTTPARAALTLGLFAFVFAAGWLGDALWRWRKRNRPHVARPRQVPKPRQ